MFGLQFFLEPFWVQASGKNRAYAGSELDVVFGISRFEGAGDWVASKQTKKRPKNKILPGNTEISMPLLRRRFRMPRAVYEKVRGRFCAGPALLR